MQKAESENLDTKVLSIWAIVYDGNPSLTYTVGDVEKAMASVEGAIRGYIGDADVDEDVYDQIMTKIRAQQHCPCIPISMGNMNIVLYHWELDKMHPIHQVLRECYDKVDEDLQSKILSLFYSSRYQ